MSLESYCSNPACGRRYLFPDVAAGRSVRCHACGEHIRVRIDREHDLSAEFDGASDWPSGYVVHKEVVGQQCFRRIGLDLTFDAQKRLTDQRATGGALVSREDYEAALSGTSRAG